MGSKKKKKICYNCIHRNLEIGHRGAQCENSLYQDQSVDLEHNDRDWAERCSQFKERKGDD